MAMERTISVNKIPLQDEVVAGKCVSAVSWKAIIAGALAAAAISLVLLILGSALGLSTVSPWRSDPESIASFTVKTAIWLIVMQWVSSGIGGYLTGRLRVRWPGTSLDEVFFRDTANGFLTWAVATLFTATILARIAAGVIGGGAHIAASMHAAPPPPPQHAENDMRDPTAYYIDGLFRSATPNPNAPAPEVRMETTRILLKDLKTGTVSNEDKAYLTQLVSAHAGLSQTDASRRVDNTITQLNATKEQVKQEAEKARKTAMHVSLYIALSFIIGAFIASAAAALGGQHRDEY